MKWDAAIRERGWILKEGDRYLLWYTGYDGAKTSRKRLGLATSPDGRVWTRSGENPLPPDAWVEDMMVVKENGRYHMFAEGEKDVAQELTSDDGIHWVRIGPLDVRKTNGEPISAGAFGTPTVWVENGTWHLFYERSDKGVWLATSRDRKVWTNVSDEPVLARGQTGADRFAIALNQIVKHGGRYYAFYHGSDLPSWKEWTVNVAVSSDLRSWTKYSGNPIATNNESSGIVVRTGRGVELFTMHGMVRRHAPAPATQPSASPK
ncbi:MAG TPA: glycosylase, partial [Planctomycetia bacterium]|nr:glycosylase [Planctomycetia bacterium]